MTATLFGLCCLALVGFTFITGFHDAPNGTAIPVKTRALTPRIALRSSAFFNVMGFLIAGILLMPVTTRWLTVPHNNIGLSMALISLLTVCIWGMVTWWYRMPSSSTHALLGGLAGVAWAAQAVGLGKFNPFNEPLVLFAVIPLVIAPLLLFVFSWAAVFPFFGLIHRVYPSTVNQASRNILSLSNSLISLVHGIQTGQRAVIIFAVMLLSTEYSMQGSTQIIATIFLALILGLGTACGSSRIGYTFAHQMVRIDPFRGAVAQSSAALALVLLQFLLGTPVSSSHLTASAALGSGVNQRFASVRHKIVLRIILTWIITIPASFGISAILFLAFSPLLSV